ncbi:MAG: NTP transferase domain-containing protein [Euryarchaeota archaeon]|mgnify:FL=1|jgi:glucose-1-phosphate thymidylyltransferase|nr:NTP transferase domain-containing protein [Euryarchaeota archaeon]
MKAILVAGGHGSRLLPMTNFTHKTLLPLCGKPIIDYALATIRNCGIEEITIIGNRFIDKIRNHVGDEVRYVLEESPQGVAAALQLAREGNEGTPLMIWFSDNITNLNLRNEVHDFTKGAVLLTREVQNPEAFGVAVVENNKIVDVVEKPSSPPSNLAIGGIYLFDETFWNRLDKVENSQNFSISDITKQYILEGSAKAISVGDNTWIDCGTPEGLQRAAEMVERGVFIIQGDNE